MRKREPKHHCPNIPHAVILFLGGFAIIGLLGIIWLTYLKTPAPEGLLLMVTSSVAALTAILSNTKQTNSETGTAGNPAQVEVTNDKQNPVPTSTQTDPI